MIQIATGQKIGPYRVQEYVGRGGFAQVFRAETPGGVTCILKLGDESGGGRFLPRRQGMGPRRDPSCLGPDEAPAEALFLDPATGARPEVLTPREVDEVLLGEIELLRAADGQGVVRLLDVTESGGRPVLVLEDLRGQSLRERIRNLQGIRLSWLVTAARTVEHLAGSGRWICHGDLKPENLVVAADGTLVLLDPAPAMNRADMVVATPAYNPFLRRSTKGDAQCLAILLYEVVCGALPFDRVPWEYAGLPPSVSGAEERRLSLAYFLAYPRPRLMNPRTPVEIERIIYRALCDDQYGLSDLRRDLEDFILRV